MAAPKSGKTAMALIFKPFSKSVSFQEGETILDCAQKSSIPLNHSCGGMGSCGTCRVFVEAGLEKLEPRNEVEQEMATALEYAPEERLACQTLAVDGVVVKVPSST